MARSNLALVLVAPSAFAQRICLDCGTRVGSNHDVCHACSWTFFGTDKASRSADELSTLKVDRPEKKVERVDLTDLINAGRRPIRTDDVLFPPDLLEFSEPVNAPKESFLKKLFG